MFCTSRAALDRCAGGGVRVRVRARVGGGGDYIVNLYVPVFVSAICDVSYAHHAYHCVPPRQRLMIENPRG